MNKEKLLDDFANYLEKTRKSNGEKRLPRTIEIYLYYLEKYIEELYFLVNKDKITMINTVLHNRPSRNLASAFIIYLRSLQVPNQLIKQIKMPQFTASALTSKREMDSKVISRDDLKKLFNNTISYDLLLLKFLYDTGCRREEILSIKHKDIKLRECDSEIGAEIQIKGKGSKKRKVYLTPETVDLYIFCYGNSRVGPVNPKDLIFIFYRDSVKKIKYTNQSQQLYREVCRLTEDILGTKYTPHCFRHTCLSHMQEMTHDIMGVSKYAGHTSIKITEIYAQMDDSYGEDTFRRSMRSKIEKQNNA